MNIIFVILIIILCVFIGIILAQKYNHSEPITNEYYETVGSNYNNFVPVEINRTNKLVNEDPQLEKIKEYDIMNNQIYQLDNHTKHPPRINYNMEEDPGSENNSIVSVKQILPYFNQIKFNQEYRDVLTSINDLVPADKQIFNVANIPLLRYSEPAPSEAMEMTLDFIDTLNVISKNNTQEYNKKNGLGLLSNASANNGFINYGWGDKFVEKTVESGWEKTQKSLGLPPSLYVKPAPYSPVSLVAIKKVQKYETDDEIKFVIYMVLQKEGVVDQILLKVSLVINKRIIRDMDKFLDVKVNYQNNDDYTFKPDFNVEVVVENVDVQGFFTNKYGTFKAEDFGTLYAKYDDIEYSNMTSNKYIRKVLLDKYNKRNEDINRRNATLDDEGKVFHATMSGVSDYCQLGLSATIFDDIDAPRLFC